MQKSFHPESYRVTGEHIVLALTLFLVLTVIAITATATLCTSVVFLLFGVWLAYASARSHHLTLMERAFLVNRSTAPDLDRLVEACKARLRPGPVDVFVTRSRAINAYTFGLSNPKGLVLFSSLFQIMDEDELRFIIGHEMGHVALGHTWLNSLVGSLAGIPGASIASAILGMAFLWWSRMCELSADRAGLLACGNLDKAISSLVKLVAGPTGLTPEGLERAYRAIDAEDDTWMGSLGESLASHPMLIRRINELRRFASARGMTGASASRREY
jgi:Zn-dependent protease with chaperone function